MRIRSAASQTGAFPAISGWFHGGRGRARGALRPNPAVKTSLAKLQSPRGFRPERGL